MELRYNEVERARTIFERYVRCLPTVKAWVRYAKFEMRNGEVARARACYEHAVEEMGDDANTARGPGPVPLQAHAAGSQSQAANRLLTFKCSLCACDAAPVVACMG
jgi:hypothetical protein